VTAGYVRDPGLPALSPIRDAEEFQFALTDEDRTTLYSYLFPNNEGITNRDNKADGPSVDADDRPPGTEYLAGMRERGVIGIITRSTGENRTTYLLTDLIEPQREDDVYIEVRQGSPRLLFSAGYRTRATARAAEVDGGGLIYFHSHPGWSAYPSRPDRNADRTRLYNAAMNLGPTVPLAAVIVAECPPSRDRPPRMVRAGV
jgi:proteasome lid subunit RPN8/RPN11